MLAQPFRLVPDQEILYYWDPLSGRLIFGTETEIDCVQSTLPSRANVVTIIPTDKIKKSIVPITLDTRKKPKRST